MRTVLDANIIAPGFASDTGTPAEVVRAWLAGQFEVVISAHLVAEVRATWAKPYWKSRIPPAFIVRALDIIKTQALAVDPVQDISGVATHWQDDMVIATAIAGDAAYLVTGDKELLRLKSYKTVSIVSPQEFREILGAEDDR